MDGVSVGIDLGSEIKVAWFNPIKGIVTQIKNAEGQLTTPAIVSLAGDLKIGELAAGALTDSPKRPFVFYWQHHQISQPGIVATPTGNYRFSDILLLIFKKIRQDIEFYFFNTALIHVTLAYPSFYDSLQRHFLMEAVKNAGFGSVSLLPAAIATAVAFEKKELQLDNFILICDFGAQSCRLTILNRIQKDLAFEIWGESDNFPFGGNQVDWLLYQYVEERIFSEIDEPNSPKELDGDLFRECRTAKEILSSGKDSKQIRSLFKQKLSVTHFKKFESIKQSDFKNLIQESLHAVVNNIGKFIDNAESKSTNKVTQILLTGGSAHLLGLKEILKKNFQERINFFS